MPVRKSVSAFLALSIAAASLAQAQPMPHAHNGRGPPPRMEPRGGPGPRFDRPGPDRRDVDRRDFDRRHADRRDARDWRGVGPDHRWHRGDRLPPPYRSRQYVVDDWRGHRLSAPPRGYQWVQLGGDYVLVAIATGVIASLILNQ